MLLAAAAVHSAEQQQHAQRKLAKEAVSICRVETAQHVTVLYHTAGIVQLFPLIPVTFGCMVYAVCCIDIDGVDSEPVNDALLLCCCCCCCRLHCCGHPGIRCSGPHGWCGHCAGPEGNRRPVNASVKPLTRSSSMCVDSAAAAALLPAAAAV